MLLKQNEAKEAMEGIARLPGKPIMFLIGKINLDHYRFSNFVV